MPLQNPGIARIPTQEAWKALPMVNSWKNTGGVYNPAGYWKDSFGVVHLRGAINGGNQKIICTLPTGYRPAYQECLGYIAGGSFGRLDIQADGVISQNSFTGNCILDGLTFRAI